MKTIATNRSELVVNIILVIILLEFLVIRGICIIVMPKFCVTVDLGDFAVLIVIAQNPENQPNINLLLQGCIDIIAPWQVSVATHAALWEIWPTL